MNHSSFAAREAVLAVVSDDHSAEAGEAALRAIIAQAVLAGGTDDLADLVVELASKLAEMVEQLAQDQGLLAVDVLDILFVDSLDLISLRLGFDQMLGRPDLQHQDPQDTP